MTEIDNAQKLIDIASFVTELRLLNIPEQEINDMITKISAYDTKTRYALMADSLSFYQEVHNSIIDDVEFETDRDFILKLLKDKGIIQ